MHADGDWPKRPRTLRMRQISICIPFQFLIVGADHFRAGPGLTGKNQQGGYSKSLQLNSVGPDRLDRLADNDDNEPGVTPLQSDNSNVLCFSR